MASLRTAFLQAANPTNKPFSTIIAYLPTFNHAATTSDDIQKQRKTQKLFEGHQQSKPKYFRSLTDFKNDGYKIINRFINLNINNFSQLLNHELNDFKDCENLVHVLQIEEQDEDQFRISQVETIQSITMSFECSTGDGRMKQQNGQYKSSQDMSRKNSYEEDFSEVQDFQS